MRINLTLITLIVVFLQVSQASKAQNITISKKNASLVDIFKEIKKQSGYDFVYKYELLKSGNNVNIDVSNQKLNEVLKKCFENQPFGYSIENKTVVIVPLNKGKETAPRQISGQVKGQVKDRDGQPLPGVAVKIKNTNIAEITNTNGEYTLKGVDAKSVLVFSFIGFQTREITVGQQSAIDVVLNEDVKALSEVVVIGYGTVKREDLTGAVGIVKVEQLTEAPVMSFDQALAGRIAGVQVNMAEGQPGAEGVSVVIRGAGSLTQDITPLYVIDGFPNEHFDPGTLNMDDIESINILKDASAIAIYGARASNGVVVIETKKGKVGKAVVTYNGSFGSQEIVQRMEMMDPYEFVRYQIDKGRGSSYLSGGRTLEGYRDVKGVDWQDQVFRTGTTYINNLAVRGGTDATKYAVSGSVFNNEGVIINTGQDRYQGRISLTQKVNKNLSAGINLNYTQRNYYGTQASVSGNGTASAVTAYLLYSVLGYRPLTSEIDFDADDFDDNILDDEIDWLNDYRVNPILDAKNIYNKYLRTDMVSNGDLEYKIIPGLVFKVQGSVNKSNNNREYFYNSETRRGNELYPNNLFGQWGGKTFSERFTWSNENILTYKKTIAKTHRFEGMVGFSNQKSSVTSDGYIGIHVPDESKGIKGLGAGESYTISGSSSEYALQSYFGRVNYDYKSKYFITGTFRADGSSRFSPQNRWGYFPSAALSWRISKEDFMKNIRIINDAKLRASYGFTGNNRVSDYAYMDLVNFDQSVSYSWGNSSPTLGAYASALGNPDLKWETTEQLDIGLDLALLKNRINIVVDYYNRTTHDLLLNANMPLSTGYNRVFKNIGSLRNEGIEFTLSTTNIRNKDFKWESDFNISFNNNIVLGLSEGERTWLQTVNWNGRYTSPLYIAEIGKPAGQMYGYIWEGNYQNNDFIDNGSGIYTKLKTGIPVNNPDGDAVQPGDIKYKDLNGDGIINDRDQTVIGRGTPIHTGGFYNGFTYKGFRLGALLQWVYGNNIYNANKIMFEGATAVSLNQFASYADRWTPENPSNVYYRVGGEGPPGYYSTKDVEDGSFLRLKTVELGYSLSNNFLKRAGVTSLGITAAAQNLWVWSNYSGYDPEVSTRPSVLTSGFDFSAYPHAKTIVLGLKATF